MVNHEKLKIIKIVFLNLLELIATIIIIVIVIIITNTLEEYFMVKDTCFALLECKAKNKFINNDV